MILDDITAAVSKRLAADKAAISPEEMKQLALKAPKPVGYPFEQALSQPG